MWLETVSVIIFGALAVIGLYDIITMIEDKFINTYKSKKAVIAIALDDNDEDVEYAIKCSLNKLTKLQFSKNNSILSIGYNLNEENEKIVKSLANDYNNIFYEKSEDLKKGFNIFDY
ncbi:MAG: hypothetical protein RR549_04480 [Oscillospiraceae bacterium]